MDNEGHLTWLKPKGSPNKPKSRPWKKRWWHFRLPEIRYQCIVIGGGPPTVMYEKYADARKQAVHLAERLGLPVYITKTIGAVIPQLPESKEAKAPLYYYDYVEEDWFFIL